MVSARHLLLPIAPHPVILHLSRPVITMSNATTALTMASAPAPKVYLLHDNDKVRSWVS